MNLNSEQKLIAEQLTSFFENSTIHLQYDYAEKLGDGRGITAGRCGFTTGTYDAHIVVKRYSEAFPENPLAKYLPELERLDNSDDKDETRFLNSFESNWKLASKDPNFRRIQDEINDELYFQPSQNLSDELGLELPLSRAAFYDTCIQHGLDDDPDSLTSIIVKTKAVFDQSVKMQSDEIRFLKVFLQIRKDVLLNTENKESKSVWAESAERVDVFTKLIEQGNFQLTPPFRISCFGETVLITSIINPE
jgi:chitosanase